MSNYTKTEKFLQANENKVLHIEGINEQYWSDFELNSGKAKGSLAQYKSAVRRFILYVNRDVLESTIEELNTYLVNFEDAKTRENQMRYIQSFIVYTISNNMDKAIINTNSDLILSLIPVEYKNLIKVLMNK